MPFYPPRGGGAINPAWLANEIFVSPSGNNSSSGKAGAPKRTIYDGLETLLALGGGTLTCDSDCYVGGPVTGQGIWLRRDFQVGESQYFDVPGFLPLNCPIRILGNGGSAPAGPFTLAPTTDYIGGGSSQFKPALWIVGCPIPDLTFEMVNMQSSWLHQAQAGIPANLRAGKLGARIWVDFHRELNGDVKQIPVLNATRTGTSTVLTVDIDAVTPVAAATAERTDNVTTLSMTNPGYPFAPWSKRGHVKVVSGNVNFPGGDYVVTAASNFAQTNTNWYLSYADPGPDMPSTPVTDIDIFSHACSPGELIWLSVTSGTDFNSQQYYVTSTTDDTITILDNFGNGDSDEDDIGTVAVQERRRIPTIYTRFERCSQGIDSSFSPAEATHSWDIGGNLAIAPEFVNCWGEGSIGGGDLPNYDWRNFAALFGYAGSGSSTDDAGCSVILRRFMCNNGGICVEASPFGAISRLIATDYCLVEQSSFDSELPGILFKGNNYSACQIEDFENADGAAGVAAVKIESTPMSAAYVVRSGKVDGACIGGDSWRTPGAWMSGSTEKNPWTRAQVTTWADGRLTGKHPAAARLGAPVTARFENVIADASLWEPDAGGTVTPGGGVSGPFGRVTDLIETTNVSNTLIKPPGTDGRTWEAGGIFALCGWVNIPSGTFRDDMFALQSAGFTPSLATTGPGYCGTDWQFVSVYFEITAVSDPTPDYTVYVTLPANASVSFDGMTGMYFPADMINDAYEFVGTQRSQGRYLQPGDCGTLDGQKFIAHAGLGTDAANAKVVGIASGELTLTGTGTVYLPTYDEDGTTIIGWVAQLQATVNP